MYIIYQLFYKYQWYQFIYTSYESKTLGFIHATDVFTVI